MKWKIKPLKLLILMMIMLLAVGCRGEPGQAADPKKKFEWNPDKNQWEYTAIDTKHTSAICWKTIGFHITKKSYPDGIPKGAKGTIYLNAKNKITNSSKGLVYTTFIWSASEMEKACAKAGVSATSLKKEKNKIYFHSIIQVYNIKTGKNIGKPKHTLPAIKTAQNWKNPNDFKDHFNIPVEFVPNSKVPVSIQKWIWDSTGKKWVKYGAAEDKGKQVILSDYTAPDMPITVDQSGKEYWMCRVDYNERGKKSLNGRKTVEGNPRENLTSYKKSVASKLQNREYNVGYKGIVINYRYKIFKKPGTVGKDLRMLSPELSCAINSREYQNEEFESSDAIPSSESQYIRVVCNQYLYEVAYTDHKGSRTYSDAYGNKVVRKWWYTEITKLNVWVADHADVTNISLPMGIENHTQRVLPQKRDGMYLYRVYKKGNSGHILQEPETGSNGLPLAGTLGMFQCVDDFAQLVSNGNQTLFDIGTNEGSPFFCGDDGSPEIIQPGDTYQDAEKTSSEQIMYRSGLTIPTLTQNGDYTSYCEIYYANVTHYNASTMAELKERDTSYDMYKDHDNGYNANGLYFDAEINSDDDPEDINQVTVLTPTICDGMIQVDNANNQQIDPPDNTSAQIVLDNSFSIKLPTTGWHSDRKGYQERDYSKYMRYRQVKFTFDCYDLSGSSYYPKNTWIEIGKAETKYFYLPTWVDESYVTTAHVNFRTIAINNVNTRIYCQEIANAEGGKYYGASDYGDVSISGSIFDLRLYDISDYPLWRMAFREDNSLKLKDFWYRVGTKDKYGNDTTQDALYTFPLMEGSHFCYPQQGVLKTGYIWRFRLKTIGNYTYDTDSVRIKPSFYYVKSDGTRQPVDIWYSATVNTKNGAEKKHLVKVGSSTDFGTRKLMNLGNVYTSVPDDQIKKKAELLGKSEDEIRNTSKPVYCYSEINIGTHMQTYVGDKFLIKGKLPIGVNPTKVQKSVQQWYFQYSLPGEIHICNKGTDVMKYGEEHNGIDYSEPFWITKDGYLDIKFDIEAVKGTGSMNPKDPEYETDLSDGNDPIYFDWYTKDLHKIWAAKTEEEAEKMSEHDISVWETMYNSYDANDLFNDIDEAKAAADSDTIIEDSENVGTEDKSEETPTTNDPFLQGVPYLSYINEENHQKYGNLNMWLREGTDLNKKDSYNYSYKLDYGDICFCYLPGDGSTTHSTIDDYRSSGVH